MAGRRERLQIIHDGPEYRGSDDGFVARLMTKFGSGELLHFLNTRPCPIEAKDFPFVTQAIERLEPHCQTPYSRVDLMLCKQALERAKEGLDKLKPYTPEEQRFAEQIADLPPNLLFRFINSQPPSLKENPNNAQIIKDIIAWRSSTAEASDQQNSAYLIATITALDHALTGKQPIHEPERGSHLAKLMHPPRENSGFRDLGTLDSVVVAMPNGSKSKESKAGAAPAAKSADLPDIDVDLEGFNAAQAPTPSDDEDELMDINGNHAAEFAQEMLRQSGKLKTIPDKD